jgi:hypothetical protein
MTTYADHLIMRDARSQFFAAHEATFGKDGGYERKWIRMEIGPLPLYYPNILGRDRAVRLHDLHHIATEYPISLVGEAEIGAWEVGSGCGNFWHACLLNMWAFAMGLVIAPRRTFRAFVRGRHSDNLYHHHARLEDALLDETVGSLRERLGLQQAIVPTMADVVSFIVWATLSVLAVIAPPAIVLAAVIAGVMMVL